MKKAEDKAFNKRKSFIIKVELPEGAELEMEDMDDSDSEKPSMKMDKAASEYIAKKGKRDGIS